jgi:hypothetical protein
MDPIATLAFIVLGMLLGAVGQGVRVIVGIKKQFDLAGQGGTPDDWFQWKKLLFSLVISLVIGGIAGSLSAIYFIGTTLSSTLLLGFIAAGYAGTDFIEGFMKTELPTVQKGNTP